MRGRQGSLILEQHVVHFPILSVLTGTVCRLRGFACFRVYVEREVAEHIPYFAGVDVILFEARERGGEKPLTERTCVIGELDHSHRCAWPPQARRVRYTRPHRPKSREAGSG